MDDDDMKSLSDSLLGKEEEIKEDEKPVEETPVEEDKPEDKPEDDKPAEPAADDTTEGEPAEEDNKPLSREDIKAAMREEAEERAATSSQPTSFRRSSP